MSETLIFIPARSGSKRLKNKNIRKVNGKPLIYWTIKYAKMYAKKNDIIVSSDSKFIQKISVNEKIKFLKRPKYISGDKSEVYFAIIHALKKIENCNRYKYVAVLQPTSPIRPKNIITNSIKILKKNRRFQNLIHLERLYLNIGTIYKKKEWKPMFKKSTRSQDIVNQFRPSGCLFLYSTQDIEDYKKFKKRKIYGYFPKKNLETVNIDREEDFLKLNYLLKKNEK